MRPKNNPTPGELPAIPKTGKIPLGPLVEHFLATEYIGKAPNTFFRARTIMEKFEAWVAGREFITRERKVDLAMYREWINHEFGRVQGATAVLGSIVVVGFLNWLFLQGVIESDSHRLVKRPRVAKKPPRPCFSIDEYKRLMEAAKGDKHPIAWLIMVGWWTGQGIHDCAMLKHSDVDLEKMEITISRKKMATRNHIPAKIHIIAGSEFHLALVERLKHKDTFWPNDAEKGLYYLDTDTATHVMRCQSDVSQRASPLVTHFKRIARKAGIDDRKSFHSFRATLCTGLANSGVNPIVACQITGHSSLASLKHYATVSSEAVSEATLKFRQHQATQETFQKQIEAANGKANANLLAAS